MTPEDVLIVEPLVEDQGRLQVAVIVGGEGGQSTPISGSELSSLLQANGQQLAADLGAVVCVIITIALFLNAYLIKVSIDSESLLCCSRQD